MKREREKKQQLREKYKRMARSCCVLSLGVCVCLHSSEEEVAPDTGAAGYLVSFFISLIVHAGQVM
jgi:hypothetical protein